jgi:hypothetical protein
MQVPQDQNYSVNAPIADNCLKRDRYTTFNIILNQWLNLSHLKCCDCSMQLKEQSIYLEILSKWNIPPYSSLCWLPVCGLYTTGPASESQQESRVVQFFLQRCTHLIKLGQLCNFLTRNLYRLCKKNCKVDRGSINSWGGWAVNLPLNWSNLP